MSSKIGHKRDADGNVLKTERDERKSAKIQNGIREWEEIQKMWRIAGQGTNSERTKGGEEAVLKAVLASIQSKFEERFKEFEKLGLLYENIPNDDPKKVEGRDKLYALKHECARLLSKGDELREFERKPPTDISYRIETFIAWWVRSSL
jgi:hypothetical protein